MPEEYAELIRYVIDRVRGEFVVSTHCHNDLGLAVANSLAGVAAGARQVECAINGLGERAGNAALEEVVMALRTRSDYFGNVETTVRTEELARTSRMVASLTGYPVQYNKAIIGRNAFAHEAGIHQHGVLEDRETYEIIDASTVGQEAAQIVLGKHSGRHAFADSLDKMGLHVQGDALNQAFTRFKELADRKVQITEADLEAIVAEELGIGRRAPVLDRRASSSAAERWRCRARRSCSATATGRSRAKASGNGMIDAAVDAISQATGVAGTVLDFKVSSVTSGGDALGDVVIQLESDGRQGVGPRRGHRRGRGVGARLPQRGQQDRAAARAPRPARGRRGRALTKEPDRVRAAGSRADALGFELSSEPGVGALLAALAAAAPDARAHRRAGHRRGRRAGLDRVRARRA